MPAPLEEKIKLSPYVANVLIHGANRPYVVAVVAPDVDAVRRWAEERGITLGDLTTDPRVRELMLREIDARSAGFAGFEVPKKVLVVEDFTTDNDLLTPTLKLRRRVCSSVSTASRARVAAATKAPASVSRSCLNW